MNGAQHCPDCGAKMSVKDTAHGGDKTYRIAECPACGQRWQTVETRGHRLPHMASGRHKQPPVDIPVDTQPANGSHARARSDSSLSLISSSSPADPDQTRAESNGKAKFWTAYDWQRKFGLAWSKAYNTAHPPGGGDSAAKACSDLGAQLDEMPADARLAAQGRAGSMFAEFLGDSGPRLVKARHPWSWFVVAFAGLLVPAKAAAPTESFAERDAREKRERAERAGREKAEAARVQRELDEQLRRAAE